MYVITAKIIDSNGETIAWKYAGSDGECPWWHNTHLSGSKFISVKAAEVWWMNHREDMLSARFKDGYLDRESIGIRKVIFSKTKSLD